ncbi:MAG: hypothetical protein MUF49_15100 [Oculatellaceae cyanobacterium Prado106]|jgi:hypothetical protein|nr:hypothetical protein [Oculatellaceae cyanobacterium Prado106]
MFSLLFFLIIGIAVGQFVKVEIDPKALRLLQDGVAFGRAKLPDLAAKTRRTVQAIRSRSRTKATEPDVCDELIDDMKAVLNSGKGKA